MDTIRALFGSKKFLAALGASIVAAAGFIGFDLSAEQVALVVGPLATFVVGQGIADHGKEAAKVVKEIQDAAPPTFSADTRLDALESWVRRHAAADGVAMPGSPPARPPGVPNP